MRSSVPSLNKRVTIYDVAERAGVAIATVSRVLNGAQNVSEWTRRKVHQAIEDLQFRPDRAARALGKPHARPLAIAVPAYTTPFYTELLKGVRDALRRHDVDLLLCDLGWQSAEATLMRFLRRGTVAGLLIAGVEVGPRLAHELQASHAPVVLVGHPHPAFDAYYWDEAAAARRAVDHLIGQGHRRIGMICAHTERERGSGRLRGYREALEAAGLPAGLVACGRTEKHAGFSEEAGFEAMQQLLEAPEPVTAVFAGSDVQALGAYTALVRAGRRVPEDVALVGMGNVKTSHYVGLTSVDMGVQDVGRRAVDTLLQRVANRRGMERVAECVGAELVVRRSSEGGHGFERRVA